MKDEKDLNSTKMDQRGKTPDIQKEIPPGAWMFVLCCKKTVVDRK
jgi:hypothetical protein